jgi:hypothetical protein
MSVYNIILDELKRRSLQYADVKLRELDKKSSEKIRKMLFPMLGEYGIPRDRALRIDVLQCLFSDPMITSALDLTLNQVYLLRDVKDTYLMEEIKNEISKLAKRLRSSERRA